MNELKILDRFVCSACGTCCRWTGSVLLEEHDLSRMAQHLNMSEAQFIARHTQLAPSRRQLALMDQEDGSCEFLRGNRCSIYDARPEQCRTFPFAWSVAEGCPELDRLRAEEKNIDRT